MRTKIAILVILAQFAVLAFMAGEREWVMRTGRPVFLRTAPIDPRDPMRGDYVRLNYEITTVPKSLCRDGVKAWFGEKTYRSRGKFRDRRVYARLKVDATGLAELVSLSDREPDSGLFLAGRVDAVQEDSVDVRYGVEALFMQQGRALEFENEARGPKAGVPVNVEVAVSGDGLAVVKGHRWEPLGITLTMDSTPRTQRGPGVPRPGLRGVTVELKNHSDAPVAIVDRPNGESFRLVPGAVRWGGGQSRWEWVGGAEPRARPAKEHIKVLKPGERYSVHIDFTAGRWFVRDAGSKEHPEARSFADLGDEWGAWFRLEYAPPTAEECADLPDTKLILHRPLRSRSFSPQGNAD